MTLLFNAGELLSGIVTIMLLIYCANQSLKINNKTLNIYCKCHGDLSIVIRRSKALGMHGKAVSDGFELFSSKKNPPQNQTQLD